MDFLLFVIGIVFIAVICAAVSLVAVRKQPNLQPIEPRPVLQRGPEATRHTHCKHKRALPTISIKECETLLRASEGVLFISLDEKGEHRPLPFYNMYYLTMTPRQLANEMRWFPSDTCVVLCGDTSLCPSLLGLLENVRATPPIYVLRDSRTRSEVA